MTARAPDAVRNARAAWEQHERRTPVQLSFPEDGWPEYAQGIATDRDIDEPGYFDCTSADTDEKED